MEYQHGGDIYSNCVRLDFSANINPLGMPEGVKRALIGAVDDCVRYPDSRCGNLRAAISAFHSVSEESVICGNGAADLIFTLVQAVRPRRALLVAPSFLEYEQALRAVDCQIEWFDLKEEDGFRLSVPALCAFLHSLEISAESAGEDSGKYPGKHSDRHPAEESFSTFQKRALPDILFLCNPNNPTGFAVENEYLRPLLDFCESRGILCVMDECFNDFLDMPDRCSLLAEVRSGKWRQLFILRAFTKIYGMAGVRLGYGLTSDRELLERIERCRQPWSVSALAQTAGVAALRETEYIRETKRVISRERQHLKEILSDLGFGVYDSMANYVFFKDELFPAERGLTAENVRGLLYEECLARGVLVRSCWNYRGLDCRYYRVCVRTERENDELAAILQAVMKDRRKKWQSQS